MHKKRKAQDDNAPTPKKVKGRVNVDVDDNGVEDNENVDTAFDELFTSKSQRA